MNKLTNVEAQRIMAVLDECLDHTEMVTLQSQAICSSRPSQLAELVGQEVADALHEHHQLQQAAMLHAGAGTTAAASISATSGAHGAVGAGSSEGDEPQSQLKHHTRGLSRVLKQSPDVLDKLRGLQPEPTPALQRFLRVLSELRNVTYHKLLTSVEEERSRQDFLAELMARERKATSDLRALQKELADERRERDKLLQSRHDTAAKLQAELEEIQSSLGIESKHMESETKAKETEDRALFQAKETQLKAEIAELTSKLAERSRINKENEQALRKRLHKGEQEVENWIVKYDLEMSEKDSELRTLSGIYDGEKARLHRQQQEFEVLSKKRKTLLDEENRLAREQQARDLERSSTHMAAWRIQRWWRKAHPPKKGKKGRKGSKRSGGKRSKSAGSGGGKSKSASRPATAASKKSGKSKASSSLSKSPTKSIGNAAPSA